MSWIIQGQHPTAEIFDRDEIRESELELFAGIIWTEGVPSILRDSPLVFEAARRDAAVHLSVHSKAISLIGSARLGFSVAPAKFGQQFSESTSDIDLLVVDEKLFKLFAAEHDRFMRDWQSGRIHPRSETEQQYWESSRLRDPNNIRRGFLDGNHVPPDYPVAARIGRAGRAFADIVREKMGRAIGKRASFRIYRSWTSVLKQNTLNLSFALRAKGVRIVR